MENAPYSVILLTFIKLRFVNKTFVLSIFRGCLTEVMDLCYLCLCFVLLQMLVVFKSAPILKRALKVRHAMMQLYIMKLLTYVTYVCDLFYYRC